MSLVKLPNGLQVHALEGKNAIFLNEEIFEDDVYFQHGIGVRDGDCVFDVGANIGLFLVRLNQVMHTGRVFCFEPIPVIFAVLEENATLHNRLDLTLMNVGLSRQEGSAQFAFYPKTPYDSTMYVDDSEAKRDQDRAYTMRILDGQSPIRLGLGSRLALAVLPRFVKRRLADWLRRRYLSSQPVECLLRPLSAVIDEHKVERIDLLKMDVERAEFDILGGLRSEHWPLIRQIVMETHDGPEHAQAMTHFLQEHGLVVHCDSIPNDTIHFMIYARRL